MSGRVKIKIKDKKPKIDVFKVIDPVLSFILPYT